jgi:hypothetical protein
VASGVAADTPKAFASSQPSLQKTEIIDHCSLIVTDINSSPWRMALTMS